MNRYKEKNKQNNAKTIYKENDLKNKNKQL